MSRALSGWSAVWQSGAIIAGAAGAITAGALSLTPASAQPVPAPSAAATADPTPESGSSLTAGQTPDTTRPMPRGAPPPPGGVLGVLKLGRYVCELPGDAMGDTGIHVPDEDFTIVHGSVYTAGLAQGSYLQWGGTVEMTSGPKSGQHFVLITPNEVRRLNKDETKSQLRCIRQVLNNRADG